MIKGIHHIAMKCSADEFSTVLSFYTDILDLDIIRIWGNPNPQGAMIDTGNGTIIEILVRDNIVRTDGIISHFAFATENLNECITRIQNAGYPITIGPKEVFLDASNPIRATIAFCRGPLGEEIEFFEEV